MNGNTRRVRDWLLIQPELRKHIREQESDDGRTAALRKATERVLDLLPGLDLAQVDWRSLTRAAP